MEPETPKDAVFRVRRRPGIKICPRCGSMDVDATTGTGYVSPPLFVCNGCGFAGAIFPELDSEDAVKHARSVESGKAEVEEEEASEGEGESEGED